MPIRVWSRFGFRRAQSVHPEFSGLGYLEACQRLWMGQRQDYGREDFIQHFEHAPDIAAEVWSALSHEAVVEGFKPHPDDDLLQVFGLADEDLDDLVLELLERCHCRVPHPSETDKMPRSSPSRISSRSWR